MSVKHATQEPQQAAEWEQGINNTSRKPKKSVDPNSKLGELAAKKYKEERLKVRRILTVAVNQALKDELAEFESQVLDSDIPTGFFAQHAQLEAPNYGGVAMLLPSNADSVELKDLTLEPVDLTCLDAYTLPEITDRYNYLVDNQNSLDDSGKEELRALHQCLALNRQPNH